MPVSRTIAAAQRRLIDRLEQLDYLNRIDPVDVADLAASIAEVSSIDDIALIREEVDHYERLALEAMMD